MDEKELIKLGFDRIHVNKEDSGDKDDYYYYRLKRGPVMITSNINLESVDEEYELFIEVSFTDVKDENGLSLKKLIEHLNFKYKE